MTEDTRKTWYWTGGLLAGFIALVAAIWFAGMFDPSAVPPMISE